MGIKKNQLQAAVAPKFKSAIVSLSPSGAGNMQVLAATPVGMVRRMVIGPAGQYTNVFNGDDIPHTVQWQIDTTPISVIQTLNVESDFNPRNGFLVAGQALNLNIGEAQSLAPLTATVCYLEEVATSVTYGGNLVTINAVGPTTLVPAPPAGKIRIPSMDAGIPYGDPVIYNSDLANARIATLRANGLVIDTISIGAGAAPGFSAVCALSAGQSLTITMDDVPVSPLYVMLNWDDYDVAP